MATKVTEPWYDIIFDQLEQGVETTTNIKDSPYYSPMSMSAEYYLGIDITLLTLQILSIIGNGFIILLFLGTTRLRKNLSLRLLLLLYITDFVFAISSLPYTIYYTAKWNPIMLDYDPMYIITSSLPLVIQFKVNLIITIMIAVDRLQAMKVPTYYRRKKHMLFTWETLALGLILAAVDVFLEYRSTQFNVRRFNCPSIGCFQDPGFKAYWGISNMVLNTVALVLTLWVAFELKKIKVNAIPGNFAKRDAKQMIQANKLSFGILIMSFVFLMIPSTFVGIVELTNLRVFKVIGPFYILGLLLAGISNSIVYITLHVELRQAAIRLIKYKTFMKETTSVATIGVTTTFAEGQ